MENRFFEQPILNSPYAYPTQHWELDDQGQPTHRIIKSRRRAEFITPIPKPRKRKKSDLQQELLYDEGKGLSTEKQRYDPNSMINLIRRHVNTAAAAQLPPSRAHAGPRHACQRTEARIAAASTV